MDAPAQVEVEVSEHYNWGVDESLVDYLQHFDQLVQYFIPPFWVVGHLDVEHK